MLLTSILNNRGVVLVMCLSNILSGLLFFEELLTIVLLINFLRISFNHILVKVGLLGLDKENKKDISSGIAIIFTMLAINIVDLIRLVLMFVNSHLVGAHYEIFLMITSSEWILSGLFLGCIFYILFRKRYHIGNNNYLEGLDSKDFVLIRFGIILCTLEIFVSCFRLLVL